MPKSDTFRGNTSIPAAYTYHFQGKERKASYEGRITIRVTEDERRVTAERVITRAGGRQIRLVGHGTLWGKSLALYFSPVAQPIKQSRSKQGPSAMTPRLEKTGKPIRYSITGSFVPGRKVVRMFVRKSSKPLEPPIEELWTYAGKQVLWKRMARTLSESNKKWMTLPIRREGPGLLRVIVPSAAFARGLFLPKGALPPALEPLEEACVVNGPTSRREPGLPDYFDAVDAGVWIKTFSAKEANRPWQFWFRDINVASQRTAFVDVAPNTTV